MQSDRGITYHRPIYCNERLNNEGSKILNESLIFKYR
jgi:hypothetical protein